MSEWQALGAGFAFYLILEGLLPFFNPVGFKKAMMVMMQTEERHLRQFGGVMIVCGLILLFSIK